MKDIQVKSKFDELKLIVVTRGDITPGYQLVQATHSIADFIIEYPELSKHWKSISNSIITLSIKDEAALLKLHTILANQGHPCQLFREPDIDNEATSMCIYGTPDVRKSLSNLSLSLRNLKNN